MPYINHHTDIFWGEMFFVCLFLKQRWSWNLSTKFFNNVVQIATWISHASETHILPVDVFWLSWWKLSQPVLQLNHIRRSSGGGCVNRPLLNASNSWQAWGLLETLATHGWFKVVPGLLIFMLNAYIARQQSQQPSNAHDHSCCLLPFQALLRTHLNQP